MAAQPIAGGALAKALERGRPRLNARYAEGQVGGKPLDAAAMKQHVATVIGPIVDAVDRIRADRVDAVLAAAFDISVDLMSAGLIGRGARHPAIADGWRHLLPRAAWLVSEDPRAAIAIVTNALYNLSLEPAARPMQWIEEMAHLAENVADLAAFRAAGQVIAWRSGMAHHRERALDACAKLQPAIACKALGISEGSDVATVVAKLREDPWLEPSHALAPREKSLRVVAQVSGFRGFGGLFLNPPQVAFTDFGIVAQDSESRWLVTADCFGTVLRRVQQTPRSRPQSKNLKIEDVQAKFPQLAPAATFAADEHTMAITLDRSHSIYLVALQ